MSRATSALPRAATVAALAAVAVALILLNVRTIKSPDLGYHLAYGEVFWTRGQIVDHNSYIYTNPPPGRPAGERPAAGPGSWYDDDGRYRFVNANWLSQVLMSAVYRAFGLNGLHALNLFLALTCYAILFHVSRRLGAPALLAGAGVGLVGLVSYSRFQLRPELFGYAVLCLVLLALVEWLQPAARAAALSVRRAAALLALQVLLVNLHSYFLLPPALAGAVAAALAVGYLRQRRRSGHDPTAARAAVRTALLTAGMLLVCVLSPWPLRLARLPLETLQYLSANDIGGPPGAHPWSWIVEFRSPFGAGFPHTARDYAFLAVLALAAAGAAAAIRRGRLWALLLIAGMTWVSLSMRRNVAVASLVIVPLALAELAALLRARRRSTAAPLGTTLGAAALLLAALIWTAAIVSQRFYLAEGDLARFGLGPSRAALPFTAAGWLDRHAPGARVWCDFASSSTIHFFTRPHREVPLVTNTWAYPPAVMQEVYDHATGKLPLAAVLDRYRVDAVVLNSATFATLANAMCDAPDWAPVQLEGAHIVFLRRRGPTADSAARHDLARPSFDVERWARKQRALDVSLERSLLPAQTIARRCRLHDLSVATHAQVASELTADPQAWRALGGAHAERAIARYKQRDRAFAIDLQHARKAYTRALQLAPGDPRAMAALTRLDQLVSGAR